MPLRRYSEAHLYSLVEQIQALPFDPDGWQTFAETAGKLTNSRLTNLYGYDRLAGSARFAAYWGQAEDLKQPYETYYAARSLTQHLSDRNPPGRVLLDSMADPDQLKACEAYNELFVPNQSNHLALVNLQNDGHFKTAFSLRRGPRQGGYGPDEVQLLEFLFPFLRQSITICDRLDRLRGVEAAMHATMNQLPHGVVLLDGRGRLLFANRPAEDIFAQKDGLCLDRAGRCRADSQDDTERLSRMIDGCIAAARGDGLHTGGSIAISRSSGKHALGVQVFPIPLTTAFFDAHRAAVGLLITDPDRKHRPPHRILAKMFGLTPSEEKLAHLLMEGLALKDCAERLEITESTARSYMKSIFSKTGVNRQGELIQLLFSSTLPVMVMDES